MAGDGANHLGSLNRSLTIKALAFINTLQRGTKVQETTPPPRSIRFSGRSFMAFVLTPEPPIDEWLAEFDTFARRSPGFFAGRPVVVDISKMPPTRPDLVSMCTELRRRHITIMGLDGRSPGELGADARGMPPILSGGKDIGELRIPPEGGTADPSVTPAPAPGNGANGAAHAAAATDAPAGEAGPGGTERRKSLLIDSPVRSGQSVVFMEGDVTVVGAVASGSEVVAGGSIHIYGALRGRAIAGSSGDRNARIFCRSMEAELVAIDGLYKTAEDLEPALRKKPVQSWLKGDALIMTPFN